MDCREFLHRYSEYDDSLIPPGEVDRFRAHMASCRSCARYDRVLRKGRMLARQLPAPEPGPDFVPRLQRRLLQHRSTRRRLAVRGPRLAAGLAAATVLMVAVSAVRLMEPGPSESPVAEVALAPTPTASPGTEPPAPRVVPHLPAAGSGVTRAWTVKMVAAAGTSSYSPLVTGPPVYRARYPSTPGTTDSERRLLD